MFLGPCKGRFHVCCNLVVNTAALESDEIAGVISHVSQKLFKVLFCICNVGLIHCPLFTGHSVMLTYKYVACCPQHTGFPGDARDIGVIPGLEGHTHTTHPHHSARGIRSTQSVIAAVIIIILITAGNSIIILIILPVISTVKTNRRPQTQMGGIDSELSPVWKQRLCAVWADTNQTALCAFHSLLKALDYVKS